MTIVARKIPAAPSMGWDKPWWAIAHLQANKVLCIVEGDQADAAEIAQIMTGLGDLALDDRAKCTALLPHSAIIARPTAHELLTHAGDLA